MAKLPSTIYKEIENRQRELYLSGETNGSVPLGDAWDIFQAAGYKISTGNKWILNWAICRCVKLEKDKEGFIHIRLGDFRHLSPNECNPGIWLPVKETMYLNESGKRARGGRL